MQRTAIRLGGVLAGVALSVLSMPAANAAPGNDGTIKLDAIAFDDAPNNEPHVTCPFQLDFYGYDEGDLSATVTFTIHPPSGRGEVLLTDEVFIGQDAAGGGTDLDAAETYDLTGLLGAYEAHPQQGYHVKVTVEAEGSIGADTKHKVFWVTDCEDKDCPPKY